MAADLIASDAPETRAVGTDPDASVRRFGERRDLPRIETVLRAEMPFGSVALNDADAVCARAGPDTPCGICEPYHAVRRGDLMSKGDETRT